MSVWSAFDLGKLKLGSEKRETLFKLAQAACDTHRYSDMVRIMHTLAQDAGGQLNDDERRMLGLSYKYVVSEIRGAYRSLDTDETKESPALQGYREQIAQELQNLTKTILELLDQVLLPAVKGERSEANVFYQKLAGDCYRYLGDVTDNKQYGGQASKRYSDALNMANDVLPPTSSARLGVALNYSVLLYEQLENSKDAVDIAKRAFDAAIAKLDGVSDAEYKDTTLIMQLLRDNMTSWSAAEEN